MDWSSASQSVTEEATTVSLTVLLSAASGSDVDVDFSVSGTATNPADFTVDASPLTILAGNMMGTVTVTLAEDTLDELGETVIVTLDSATGADLGTTLVHTLTIDDDDAAPAADFSAASQMVTEADGTATVTVSLSAASGLDVDVPFTLSGTALDPDDYSIDASPLTILAGQTSGTITVTLVDDALYEASETITLTMGSPTNATAGTTTVHTLDVSSADAEPVADFSAASQMVTEADGAASVTISLSAASGLAVDVPFTLSGTALDPDDYTIDASPLSIPAGMTSGTITVTLVDDLLHENAETIVLTMGAPTGATAGTTTVHTLDVSSADAEPVADFSAASQMVAEADGTATVTVSLSEASGLAVDVPFTLSGTAIDPDDYTVDASPLSIPAGMTSGTITVTLVDDSAYENNETIVLTMGAPTGATAGTTTVHTLDVSSADAEPVADFSAASQMVAEADGTATVTVSLSEASGLDVDVPFTLSGSALDPDDYTIDASPLTILAGQSNGTITVTLVDDDAYENAETIVLTMGAPTGATAGTTTVHTLDVSSADALPTVEFAAGSQPVNEGDGTATVTVSLSAASSLDVDVPFSLGGTALDPDDYTVDASPLSIPAGMTSGTITVTLVDDDQFEVVETILIALGTPVDATLGTTTQHTISLLSNDSVPDVEFGSAGQPVAEADGTATVSVVLSAISGEDVDVPFTLSGTALDPDDYTIDASPLTIPAGQSSGTISVTLVDDAAYETNETIVITLGAPSGGSLGATTVHTLDVSSADAAPVVEFSAAGQPVNEADGTATVTVALSEVSGVDALVPYTLSGTALDPEDYSVDASPLMIPAGQASGTITVTLVDDLFYESLETIVLTLGAPTDATLGATTVHTLDVSSGDAEPVADFSSAGQPVAEADGTATITVVLSEVSGEAVDVPFTLGGTAADPDDYTIDASPLTIPAGQSSGTITVTLVDDDDVESNETIVVTMGVPTGATAGATTVHTIDLSSEDATPTVEFTAAAQTVDEADGLVVLTVSLSATSATDVDVPFTVGGTADDPDDFSIDASPLTIVAGQSSADISIALVDDMTSESTETIVVTLGTPVGADLGASTVHTVDVDDDDDGPTVTFTASDQTLAEADGVVTIGLSLSESSGGDVTLPFSLAGSASGADYVLDTPSPIVISSGSTTADIQLTLVDDTTFELDETIEVILGVPDGATPGAITTHVVTVTSADAPPMLSFDVQQRTVQEDAGTILVRVLLDASADVEVTAPLFYEGTAEAGADYMILSTEVVVPAGQTAAAFDLTILDDQDLELSETILMRLGPPVNAMPGMLQRQLIRLRDNDRLPERPEPIGRIGALRVSTSDIAFPTHRMGDSPMGQVVTVGNRTDRPISLQGVRIGGANADDFGVDMAGGLPVVLGPGSSTTFTVEFSPLARGPRTADLFIVQRPYIELDPNQPAIRLSGMGIGQTGEDILVDVGGPGILSAAGETWSADYSFPVLGTVTESTTVPIAGTSDPVLYQTSRLGQIDYDFQVPNGVYDVTFHFAETQSALVGERVMDLFIEGALALADLDVVENVGVETALSRTYRFGVGDGNLDIAVTADVGIPMLSALEVRSIAALQSLPVDHDFGVVAQGFTPSQDIVLTNTGLDTALVTSVTFDLFESGEQMIAGHDMTLNVEGMDYSGDHEDVTHPLSLSIASGEQAVLPLTFAPSEHSVIQMTLRFEGNFDALEVPIDAIGGSLGDPYLHVVMLTPDYLVDYDGDGMETVILDGSDSHTHEVGHALTAWEWREGTTILGTSMIDSAQLSLGVHPITQEIFDDNVPIRSLADTTTVTVVPASSVPGILVRYYDADAGLAADLLDNVPGIADFGELRPTFSVGTEGGIGGSGLLANTMVQLEGTFDVAVAESYSFTVTGGTDTRVFVDGMPYTTPLSLAVGSHDLEVRFAVTDLTDMPLDVLVARGGGGQSPLEPEILTHDEGNLIPIINAMPDIGTELGGNQIVITGLGFFPEDSVVVHWGSTILDDTNFTSWSGGQIEFLSPPGTGMIDVTVETPLGTSNMRTFEYSPVGPVPISFSQLGATVSVNSPTSAEWGPDGRLYVAQLTGEIKAITYDENYNAIASQTYTGVSGLSNFQILGLAFDPFEAPGTVKIYVGHTLLYAQGGVEVTVPSPFPGQVSTLEGPNFDTPVPLITGLPSSNHDHGINGMVFTHNGDLLVTVGGNTNAGVIDPNIGDLPESPLSAAILKAETSRPDFDGAITYVLSADGTTPSDDQRDGEIIDVAPGTHVTVYASGLRNPYDVLLTTKNRVYATDNGPNAGFGPASTGPMTEEPDPTDQDELMLVREGDYFGHPNRARGRYDARENVYYSTADPSIPGVYTKQVLSLPSSTNGLAEYRATTFNSQMRGQLLAQKWNGHVFRAALGPDGLSGPWFYLQPWMHALDVVIGPGGAILGIDYSSNNVKVFEPNDVAAVGLTPVDIFPWRAPSTGGHRFEIGGSGFGTLGDTTVTIGGIAATLTSVSPRRIVGVIPPQPSPSTELLDVVVSSNMQIRTLTDAFRFLQPAPGQEPMIWSSGAPIPYGIGEVAGGVIGDEMILVGEGRDETFAYDITNDTWVSTLAQRPFLGNHHGAEVVGGKLYLIGGLSAGGGRVQIYDPVLDSWSLGMDMPWGGGSVSTCAIGDKIYAAGGIVGFSTVDNCAVYDTVLDTWTALAPMPTGMGRNHAAAGTDGTLFYVFGGRGLGSGDGNWPANGFAQVQVYDPVLDSWTTSDDMGSPYTPLPQFRGGMGKAVFHLGKFYVIGGETLDGPGATPENVYDRVDVYDVAMDTWTLGPDLPTGRHGIFPLLHAGQILIAGGGTTAGFSQTPVFEILTLP